MAAMILATVPKTGSHTMIKVFDARPDMTGSPEEFAARAENGQNVVMFRHTLSIAGGAQALAEAAETGAPVVAPMRDPVNVALSWAKQGDPWPWGGPEGFAKAFDDLFALDPFIVALDKPDWEERLRQASELTGRPLSPDRAPENVYHAKRRKLSTQELEALDYVLTLDPIQELYGDAIEEAA